MDNRSILALLQLTLTSGIGAKTLEKIIEQTVHEGIDLGDFVALTPVDQVALVSLKPEVSEQISAQRESAKMLRDRLSERDVDVLIKGDENYPNHLIRILGKTAPTVLFVQGDSRVLNRSAVGFCGSRKASENGLRIASECAKVLAPEDVNIISGYAHGVDLAAHRGALECGGVTTFVLAEGILHFRPKRDIVEFMNERNYLAISEFSPSHPWTVHNAMRRNRTICGLSDAIIVIEAGLTGGTFEAGKTALELNVPLFAVEYREPPKSAEGNGYFLEHGAFALQTTSEGEVGLSQLWQELSIPNDGRFPDTNGNLVSIDDSGNQEQLPLWDD